MASIICIGDPHFKINNVKETTRMVEAVVELVEKTKPDAVVIMGDTLDRHESIHVSPLTRALKFIFRLSEITKVYLLIGNHDLKNNRQFLSEEHPFYSLKKTRVSVIDRPEMVEIQGQNFVMVPYVPCGMFQKALEVLDKRSNDDKSDGEKSENVNHRYKTAKAIFAHQEFKGCKLGIMISEEGDPWEETDPLVISGHIHDYQELKSNIVYVGTPIQHGFDDSIDKTVSHFIFGEGWKQHRIDLGCPKKKIVRLSVSQVPLYNPEAGCELKIVISGASGELKGIMKHPRVLEWKSSGHIIKYKALQEDNSGLIQQGDNTTEVVPYLLLLQQAVEQQVHAKRWFQYFFGSEKIA